MAALAASLGFAGASALAADSYNAIKQALSTGEPERALALLKKAKSEHPKDVQLMFFEGVINAQMGDTRAAIAVFEGMAERYPELPEPHNNLGVLYAARGDLEKAKSAFERAMLTNPSYAAAHKNMADLYAAMAKQNYGKALQVDAANTPQSPQMTLLGNLTSGAKAKDAVLVATAKPEKKPAPQAQPTPDAKPQAAPQATAEAKPAAPEQPNADQLANNVEKSVMAWASAWSKRDIDGYLGPTATTLTQDACLCLSGSNSARTGYCRESASVLTSETSRSLSTAQRPLQTFNKTTRQTLLTAPATSA
ncbi:tetratricopeptide repeat protein [Comamonadaceae bacterium M7527]|nr:tetratricopeptide repeat protein [Comamonadaceae bacterium M7527]